MKILISEKDWNISKFVVGIADCDSEIDEILKLRYDIFNVELDEGIKENEKTQRDVDKFDKYCDHLIVKDTETKQLIATYRIHPSWKMNKDLGFYSATEFDMKKLGLEKRRSTEVGRACIKPEYRGRLVLIALWVGLREYLQKNKVECLFGCASLPKCTQEEASQVFHYLVDSGSVILNGGVSPLPDQKFQILPKNPNGEYRKDLISSLLKGYLKMNAKIMGEPVFDPVFCCYDFFVLLEMDKTDWGFIDSLFNIVNASSRK